MVRTTTVPTPNEVESERELLTAAFKGGGPTLPTRAIVEKLLVNLTSQYWAHPHYQKIFVAMQEAALDAGGTDLDWGDVRGNIPEESVARETLKQMVNATSVPPVTERFIDKHLARLDNAYRSRELKRLSTEVNSLAESGYSEQAYDLLSDGLISLAEDRASGGARYIEEYVDDILHEIDERRKAPGGIVGLKTDMRPIDLVWKGLEKRKLYFIGARPGNGKSVAIGQIAYNVLNNYPNKRILLASTEMDAGQYVTRLAATIAGINYDDYYGGNYDEAAAERMKTFVRALKDKRLIVNDGGGQDTHSLRQDVIVTQPDLILIDYAQEFYPTKPKYSEYADVSMFIREVNAMKKQFNVAILTALQLSRKVEERDNKRPIASDLRATGWLEQVADGIFMLYNEKKYADSKDTSVGKTVYYDEEGNILDNQRVEWVCAKNRQGEPRDVDMFWKDGDMMMHNERQ